MSKSRVGLLWVALVCAPGWALAAGEAEEEAEGTEAEASEAKAGETVLAVERGAIPTNELMDEEEEPVDVTIVVVLPPDPSLAPLRKQLADDVAKQLRKHAQTRSAKAVDVANADELDDRALAKAALEEREADRVLLVRVFPGAAGSVPKVLFTLTDDRGRPLARQSSGAVLVPKQKAVSKGVERVFTEERDDEPGGRKSNDKRLARFRSKALKAVPHVRGGKTYFKVVRGEEVLDADELKALGAPDLGLPLDTSMPLSTKLGRGAGLTICCGGGGSWVAAPCVGAVCTVCSSSCLSGTYFSLGARSVQDAVYYFLFGMLIGPLVLAVVGLYTFYFIVPAAMVWFAALAVIEVLGGVVLGVTEVMRPRPVHPVQAFVTRHNLKLAQKAGLKRYQIPAVYFPG